MSLYGRVTPGFIEQPAGIPRTFWPPLATDNDNNTRTTYKNHQIIHQQPMDTEIDFYSQCTDLLNYACLAFSTHSFQAISLSSVAKQQI
jgi:hypothetical protein